MPLVQFSTARIFDGRVRPANEPFDIPEDQLVFAQKVGATVVSPMKGAAVKVAGSARMGAVRMGAAQAQQDLMVETAKVVQANQTPEVVEKAKAPAEAPKERKKPGPKPKTTAK